MSFINQTLQLDHHYRTALAHLMDHTTRHLKMNVQVLNLTFLMALRAAATDSASAASYMFGLTVEEARAFARIGVDELQRIALTSDHALVVPRYRSSDLRELAAMPGTLGNLLVALRPDVTRPLFA